MPNVKKVVKKTPSKKVATKKSSGFGQKKDIRSETVNRPQVLLPTEYREPSDNFADYSLLIHGEKKIGKTSLCSQIEGATFLMFEPGDSALKIRSVAVPDWYGAESLLKQLYDDAGENHKCVVVDIVDQAYQMCFDHSCKQLGIAYPADNDFGKSWAAIKGSWSRWINRLIGLKRFGVGTIFISHSRWTQIKRRDGTTYDRLGPSMTGQGMGVLEGLVDTIAYYGYDGNDRVLVIRGNEHVDAGTRLDEHFKTKKGEEIRSIFMGSSKKAAWQNLKAAFDNSLVDAGEIPVIKKPETGKKGVKKAARRR
jgi:hypothetical protein